MYLKPTVAFAVALEESALPEVVHQPVDLPPCRSDQVREQVPRDEGQRRARPLMLVEVREQQENPREPLLTAIEKLADQIRLGADIPGEQMRAEAGGERHLVVEPSAHFGRLHDRDGAGCQGLRGRRSASLSSQGGFA